MSPLRRSPQRGQATPLIAAVLVLCAVVAAALALAGTSAVDAAQARTAADAAALAGAAEGEAAARAVAAAHGATVVEYRADGIAVQVEVALGRARAAARAASVRPDDAPPAWSDPGAAAVIP